MTENNNRQSITNRRYYVLMEDEACWMWSRNDDDSFNWNIIGYNSKVVSPRKEIPEENTRNISDKFAIAFHKWMKINDTQENADKYFHYTDDDMITEFKKEFYL